MPPSSPLSPLPPLPPLRLANATLEWDAAGRPRSSLYGDIYYSSGDALEESSHVFIEGNALDARFRQVPSDTFCIGELGFGAGLNFLNAWRLWTRCAPTEATLHYLACELHPLALSDMQRLHAQWPELRAFSEILLPQYPDHTAGVHQINLRKDSHRVCLTLLYGDAQDMLRRIGNMHNPLVDAWFLDGFAPRLNPALWQESLLQLLAAISRPACTLSSYSVAGHFRKGLEAAGFKVEKRPGHAGKRHMLHARLRQTDGAHRSFSPAAVSAKNTGSVCVIGGGLAGCSTARALAQSGWQVTLMERSPALASQGSGNLQAILHCKPANQDTPANQFNLHAYLHAARHYGELARTEGLAWHPCGMLQAAVTEVLRKRYRKLAASEQYPPQIFEYLDAARASELAGVPLQDPALYFPAAGWLSPPALCALYVRHPGIQVMRNMEAEALDVTASGWRIKLRGDTKDAGPVFDKVVLCNSADVHSFRQTRHYPLVCNRGQVDVYPASADTAPAMVLCGQGWILPAMNGVQSAGGSVYVGDSEADTQQQNRMFHLKQLRQISTALDEQLASLHPVQQRIGTRAALPDRMPLAGPVYSPPSEGGQPCRGLYVNTAHGSHGLTRTPICAAWLASLLDGTVAPLPLDLAALISAQRYSC